MNFFPNQRCSCFLANFLVNWESNSLNPLFQSSGYILAAILRRLTRSGHFFYTLNLPFTTVCSSKVAISMHGYEYQCPISTDTSIWHMIHNLSRFIHINIFLNYESEAHKQLWTSTSGFSVCKNKIGLFCKKACKSEMNKKPMYWSGWRHGFMRLVENQTDLTF